MAPHGLSEELYGSVADWRSYPDYTDAERIAIPRGVFGGDQAWLAGNRYFEDSLMGQEIRQPMMQVE